MEYTYAALIPKTTMIFTMIANHDRNSHFDRSPQSRRRSSFAALGGLAATMIPSDVVAETEETLRASLLDLTSIGTMGVKVNGIS